MEPLPRLWQPAQPVHEVIPTSPQLWQPVHTIPKQAIQTWKPLQRTFPIRLSPVRKPDHNFRQTPAQQAPEAMVEVAGAEANAQVYNPVHETIPPYSYFSSAEEGKQYLEVWALTQGFEIIHSGSRDDCFKMICHRGYTKSNKARENKRQREAKCCGCKFKCFLRLQPPGWSLRVSDATHNHARSDPSSMALTRKREMDRALPIIESQSKLSPREILEIIHCRAADVGLESSLRIKDVNNVRAGISRERRKRHI